MHRVASLFLALAAIAAAPCQAGAAESIQIGARTHLIQDYWNIEPLEEKDFGTRITDRNIAIHIDAADLGVRGVYKIELLKVKLFVTGVSMRHDKTASDNISSYRVKEVNAKLSNDGGVDINGVIHVEGNFVVTQLLYQLYIQTDCEKDCEAMP